MKKKLFITLIFVASFVKATPSPEQIEMLAKIKASQIAHKERITKLLGHSYTTLTIKDRGDLCVKDIGYCGDYVAFKTEESLGNLDKFVGNSIRLKVILDNQANIKSVEIAKRSENAEFDSYVISNIHKAEPFSALLSLPPNQFEIHKTLVITLKPQRPYTHTHTVMDN